MIPTMHLRWAMRSKSIEVPNVDLTDTITVTTEPVPVLQQWWVDDSERVAVQSDLACFAPGVLKGEWRDVK